MEATTKTIVIDPRLLIPSPSSKSGGARSKTASASSKRAALSTERLKRQLLNTVRSHKLASGKTMSRTIKRTLSGGHASKNGGIQVSDALKRASPSPLPLRDTTIVAEPRSRPPPSTTDFFKNKKARLFSSSSMPVSSTRAPQNAAGETKSGAEGKTPWGNLKHGKKPTFRKWSRTVRTAGQSHIRFNSVCEHNDGKQNTLVGSGSADAPDVGAPPGAVPGAELAPAAAPDVGAPPGTEPASKCQQVDTLDTGLTDVDLSSIDSADEIIVGADVVPDAGAPMPIPMLTPPNPPNPRPGHAIVTSPAIIGHNVDGHLNPANRADVKVTEIFVPKKKIIRQTTQKTFKVGKRAGGTSVFFKRTVKRKSLPSPSAQNSDLRAGDQTPASIASARQCLYDRNMMRRGSSTPDELVLEMYRAIKCGSDVINERDDIQVHNFTEK